MPPSTYEADKDPTGEFLTANWSSMSEPEKDAALKAWNKDYDRRNPYTPTPSKPIDWNEAIISIVFVAALVFGIADGSARVWAMFICIYCLAWRIGNLSERIDVLDKRVRQIESATDEERKDR